MNPTVEVIRDTSDTQKGMKLLSGNQLDEISKKNITGDTNYKRIHIENMNHVQDEGNGNIKKIRLILSMLFMTRKFSSKMKSLIVI